MPGDETAAKSSAGTKHEEIGNVGFSLTEPIPARFGRKETKAVQRPKIGVTPVSKVRPAPLNPFETKRNFGADATLSGVRNGKLAEGEEPGSNALWVKEL
jgi:hypothetical protein